MDKDQNGLMIQIVNGELLSLSLHKGQKKNNSPGIAKSTSKILVTTKSDNPIELFQHSNEKVIQVILNKGLTWLEQLEQSSLLHVLVRALQG